MLRYLVAVFLTATCFAADPAIAIQIRMLSGDGVTVEVTDDQGLPVPGAAVTFQVPDKGAAITEQTHADGRATVDPAKLNHAAGTFDVKITAVKDHARAGLIARQTFTENPAQKIDLPKSEPVMPVTAAGGDGDFKASHSFHWKWIALGILAAGAGAGLYLKTQAGSAVLISSPFLAAPQIGTPTITVGHP
jgi:hypothetical protein